MKIEKWTTFIEFLHTYSACTVDLEVFIVQPYKTVGIPSFCGDGLEKVNASGGVRKPRREEI